MTRGKRSTNFWKQLSIIVAKFSFDLSDNSTWQFHVNQNWLLHPAPSPHMYFCLLISWISFSAVISAILSRFWDLVNGNGKSNKGSPVKKDKVIISNRFCEVDKGRQMHFVIVDVFSTAIRTGESELGKLIPADPSLNVNPIATIYYARRLMLIRPIGVQR